MPDTRILKDTYDAAAERIYESERGDLIESYRRVFGRNCQPSHAQLEAFRRAVGSLRVELDSVSDDKGPLRGRPVALVSELERRYRAEFGS